MNATDLMAFDDAMFVACFTELPDAVSQWTRYGGNGHGLALGFDSERISAAQRAPVSPRPGWATDPHDSNRRRRSYIGSGRGRVQVGRVPAEGCG